MSIRPIEMQVLIPKVTEVSKAQHVQNNRGNIQQQEIAAAFQKELEHRQKQVQDTSKSEHRKVDRDKEHEKNKHAWSGEDEKKDGTHDGEKSGESNQDPLHRGAILDITT